MDNPFDLDPGIIYLNHAAVAPWPRRTAEAVAAFAGENRRFGAADYPRWLEVETRLRRRLARLVGAASPDDIALVKNTSEALSLIAFGLEWRPGDNVVSFAGEFPSNRLVWQAFGEQGVELRLADPASADPEAALLALCDERTRLVSISSVQYASGLRARLETVGSFCRERGILFCVDAIQSLGALPFDVETAGADFVVADGHKWMCGPEGLALFWSRPQAREQLRLLQYGWHMVEHAGDFDRSDWRPAASARRFECGSPNMLGIHALEASLSVLQEVGVEQIASQLQLRIELAIQEVDQRGFELLSPRLPERRAGILAFRVPGHDSGELHRALMQQNVICALRGGGVRFSPHWYTPLAQIHHAFEAVEAICNPS
ncbi:MAG: aminotransferase [Gammaproteobacteria bacterium]|nr:MAG: aminotransferase [Gammaproteobacteria bacterium]